MSENEENKTKDTYILIDLSNESLKIDSECGNMVSFLAALKLIKSPLSELILASVKDDNKRFLLTQTLIENELVVKPTKVFNFGENK